MTDEAPRSGYQQERDQYVARIEAELQNLDPGQFPETRRILEEILYDVRGGVTEFLEIQGTRKCKIRAKVAIPSDGYSNFNYVGKLLGPGGSNLKGMQEQTMTKMAILGQGSMRNAEKEQEMLNSGDPKFAHLKGKLHLQVDSVAEASEAFYRMSHALAEVKKFMIPDEGGPGMGGNPMAGGWGAPPMGGGGFMGGGRGGPRGGRGGPPRGGRGGDRGGGMGGGRGFRGGGGRGGPPRGGGGRGGGGQFNGGDGGSNGFGGGGDMGGGAPFDGTYEGFGSYDNSAQQPWGGGKMGGRGGGGGGGAPY